jgi:hypothetical protein
LLRQPVEHVVIEACSPAGWVHDLCEELHLVCDVANTADDAVASSASVQLLETVPRIGVRTAEVIASLAVALGDKIVAVDLFDNSATCRKVWQRLLSGFILDGVGSTVGAGQVTQVPVEAALTICPMPDSANFDRGDPAPAGCASSPPPIVRSVLGRGGPTGRWSMCTDAIRDRGG